MSPVLAIAAKDLRQRLRDRSAIVLGFVAPVVIATLMSFAFGGGDSYHLDAAVVDNDHGELAAAFTQVLRDPELSDLVTVRTVPSEADARSQVDSGEVGAAFVIPAGFTAAARGGTAAPVTVLGRVDEPVAQQVGQAIADGFAAQLDAVRLSVATALSSGATPDGLPALAAEAAARRLPEQVAAVPAGTRQLRSISYFGPAMGIFFALFAVSFTARGYFLERQTGTLDRIRAAPLRPAVVLAGKSLATLGYALASLTTMALVTTLAFDAYWGPPLAAAALLVAMALAMVGLTALVISLSRTERQAEGIAAMLTFGLVLLGGNFVYVSMAPPLLRTLALLTPNGWALRGFTDLATGAGPSAVLVPVLAMLAFTAACGGLAVLLSRRAAR
ncbi:MAG TPA: ABC transporter permease [Actinophytocola sp.]|uniref:ABC transporter permease n=1 Tax=Actinophytocola sp. TaxID=1872138 RepID=UPI002DBF921C|nr:ABC transporter permease [Actinophytocola sp.]HEU5471402.1 ABC transporter permease [Actinophytocola sp.]